LWEAGEEPFFRRIARTIVREREKRLLKSTTDLVEVIAKAIPPRARRARKIHFATNTFRALRMTVNDELGSLREALPKAITLLAPKGRLLVISFHSLEDRIVKQTLKAEPDLKVLTKKPIIPTPEEIESNPRARSARLRIAIKRDRRNTN
jgi:16S rRNA (cytosine1402-N4)-methyltransferase